MFVEEQKESQLRGCFSSFRRFHMITKNEASQKGIFEFFQFNLCSLATESEWKVSKFVTVKEM